MITDEEAARALQINEKYRFKNIKTANGSDLAKLSQLFYFNDETICAAIKRRVLIWKEPAYVLVYSKHMPLGSGKSNDTLWMAKKLDPDFDVDNQLCFTGKDFIGKIKNAQKGKVYIWDESGIGGGSARKWQSDINIKLSEAIRLARWKQPFLFFITPYPSLIDVNIRNMCGIECEALAIFHETHQSYAIIRTVRWEKSEKGYWIPWENLPRRIREDGEVEDVKMFSFSDMSQEYPDIWRRYEERKQEALDGVDEEEGEAKSEPNNEPDYKALYEAERTAHNKLKGLLNLKPYRNLRKPENETETSLA